MGCLVEKVLLSNGESSKLFEALNSNLEPAAALETYLELQNNEKKYKKMFGLNEQGEINQVRYLESPKYKLNEFNSRQEQDDVMDFLLDEFLMELQKRPETSSKYTLTGINTDALAKDPTILPGVISAIRNKIGIELGEKQYGSRQRGLMLQAIVNLPKYIGEAGLLNPLGAKLKEVGVHVRVGENQVGIDESIDVASATAEYRGEEFDSEKYELGEELIYNMDILEMPTLNSVLPQLKMYLRSLRRIKENYKWHPQSSEEMTKNPQAVYEYTDLGTARPSKHEALMGKLFGVLKNTQSMDEMAMKLKNAVRSSPELMPVYELLMDEEPVNIPNIGLYSKLGVALFTLAKGDYDLISNIEMGDGRAVVADANSSSVRNKILDSWKEGVTAIQRVSKADVKKKSNIIESFLSRVVPDPKDPKSRKTIMNPMISKVNDLSSEGLSEAARMLRIGGFIGITKGDVLEYINHVQSNPKRFHSSNQKLTPFSIIDKTLDKVVVKGVLQGKDVFTRTGEKFGESKIIGLMAASGAISRTDIHVGAHFSNRGTVVHAYNMSSEGQDIWKKLQNITAEQKSYGKDPMYENTILLDILSNDSENNAEFRVQSFDTLSNNKKRGSGRTYGKLSTYDALAVRMQMFFNAKGTKGYFQALSPTQGDNGNLTVINVPKLNYEAKTAQKPVVRDGKIINQEVSDWISNQIRAELTRIIRAKSKNGFTNYSKTKDTSGNASKFNLFSSLNDLDIDYKALSEEDIDTVIGDMYPAAEQQFVEMLKEDSNYFVEKGLFLNKDNGGFKSRNEFLPSLTKAEMDTFLANNFIYGYEQVLFYIGDPAFFKEGTTSEQKVNMNKRFRLPFTPGNKLATTPNTPDTGRAEKSIADDNLHSTKRFYSGLGKTFQIKILKDAKLHAKLNKEYNILGEGFVKSIDIADGQGWISVNRYLQSMAARGIHSDELVDLVTQLKKWSENNKNKVTSEAKMEVLKHFYYRISEVQDGLMAPLSLKYSVMPAIPTFFERKTPEGNDMFPGLAKISRELNNPERSYQDARGRTKHRADEVVMESAVKVGIREASTLSKLDEANSITLDNDALRVPQVTPSTSKTSTRFGSQPRKLIMGNYNENITVLNMPAPQALDNYDKAIASMAITLGDKVVNSYVDSKNPGKIDKAKLVNTILKELEYNPYKNVDYYVEALRGPNGMILPTNYPTISNTLDAAIASDFSKSVSKMKLPGFSAVQTTSYGTMYNSTNVSVDSDLKFVGISKKVNGRLVELKGDDLTTAAKAIKKGNYEDYVITPAEVRVSAQYFNNRLKEIASEKVKSNTDSIDAQVTAYGKTLSNKLSKAARSYTLTNKRNALMHDRTQVVYKAMLKSVSNKEGIDIKKVQDSGLDELVLYRIPTQGKSSMLSAKIKDFLPMEASSTIQVPYEIVEQAGSDFDVDKVYIEMHKFGVKDGKMQKQSYLPSESDIEGMTTGQEEITATNFDQAQAYVMEYHKAVLQHPAHASELLIPNKTTELDRMLAVLEKGKEITGLFPSVRTQEDFRNNNKSGADMIGISSVSSVGHAMAPHIDASFINPIWLKGISDTAQSIKLGEIWNRVKGDGRARISDEIAEVQNAALDNANNPLLGHLNINEYTAGAALLLISDGQGIEFTTKFMNAPILREMSDLYATLARSSNPAMAHLDARKAIIRKYGLRPGFGKKYQSKLADFGMNDVERLMESSDKNDMTLSLQVFDELHTKGGDLSKFQTWMNLDSSGTPPTTAGIITRYSDLASIIGTVSNTLEKSQYSTDRTRLLPILRETEKREPHPVRVGDKYKLSHIATMESYLLNKPLQILKESSPVATRQFQAVLTEASDRIGYIDQFAASKVLAAYQTFLSTNIDSVTHNTSSLATRMTSTYSNMLDPTNSESTGELIKSHIKVNSKLDSGVNEFVKNLTVQTIDGRQHVLFKNSVSRGVTANTRKAMAHAYESLMDSKKSEDRALAKSLADYAVMFYGFSKSINSFMDFLPPRAHTEFMGSDKADSTAVTLPQFFESMEGTMNNPTAFTPDSISDFVHLYMLNNASTVNLPTYSEELIESSSTPPAFAKKFGNTSKRWDIYKYVGGGYTRMARRGIPNLVDEYHSNDHSYFNSKASDMAAPDKRSSASYENKEVLSNLADENDSLKNASKIESPRAYIDKIYDVKKYPIESEEDAVTFVDKLVEKLLANKETAKDINNIKETYLSAIEDATYTFNKNKESGNNRNTYMELLLPNIDNAYDEFLTRSDLDILTKINKC